MRIIAFFLLILLVIIIKYLKKYEKFENKNNVIIKPNPSGGLANYLRTIFSYNEYCKKHNKSLTVLWEVSDTCNGFFLDYFYPLKNTSIIKINKSDSKKYNIDYNGSKWHEDYSPFKKNIYTDLNILPHISEKIKKILNNYSFDAVHIRRTDHIENAKKNNRFTTDEEFIDFIKNSKDKVYLATDNRATQDKFYKLFPDKIFFNKRLPDSKNLRVTSLEDSIIDIFACTKANSFKGSGWSSFSDLINHIRK